MINTITQDVNFLMQNFLYSIDPSRSFQALFDYIDTAFFFAKDLDGHILMANTQLIEHYGFKKAEELIGKTDFDFLPRSLAEKYRWDDQRVVELKIPLIKEIELFLDDVGIPDWYITTKIPLFSQSGEVIGVMGVIQKHNSGHLRYMLDNHMSRALKYLNDHYTENIKLSDLAKISGVSSRKLQRLFRLKLNTTFRDQITRLRILKSCDLLRLTDRSISSISTECGFYDQSSFTRHFRKNLVLTPRQYRSKY
jgi:PAS domain S-box-containing protein